MPNYTDDMVATRSYSPLHHDPRPTDNNDAHTETDVPTPQGVEVITEPPQVWVITSGEYDDATPIAVVPGSEKAAQGYVDRYNAQHPDRRTAYVWTQADYIAPPVLD